MYRIPSNGKMGVVGEERWRKDGGKMEGRLQSRLLGIKKK
jgi:hypothetical protein